MANNDRKQITRFIAMLCGQCVTFYIFYRHKNVPRTKIEYSEDSDVLKTIYAEISWCEAKTKVIEDFLAD